MNTRETKVSYAFDITLDGSVKFTTEYVGESVHVQVMSPDVADKIAKSLATAAMKARLICGTTPSESKAS